MWKSLTFGTIKLVDSLYKKLVKFGCPPHPCFMPTRTRRLTWRQRVINTWCWYRAVEIQFRSLLQWRVMRSINILGEAWKSQLRHCSGYCKTGTARRPTFLPNTILIASIVRVKQHFLCLSLKTKTSSLQSSCEEWSEEPAERERLLENILLTAYKNLLLWVLSYIYIKRKRWSSYRKVLGNVEAIKWNMLTSSFGFSPLSAMITLSSSDRDCSSTCSAKTDLSWMQLSPWKLPSEESPGKLSKSFTRTSSEFLSSPWLLVPSVKRDKESVASTAGMDLLYTGGCERNGRFPYDWWASDVVDDDWYRLVQKREERENVLLKLWRETGEMEPAGSDLRPNFWAWEADPSKWPELMESTRMEGSGDDDEQPPAMKLRPSVW